MSITAGGLPNTRFYLDDGTGAFPDDITNYVLLVEGGGMSLTRGRADTDSAVAAGTLNIVLNNRTGAFTPGSTILGSPTEIKLDQRIRVKETVNGVTYIRGTYYVKSWALSWLAVAEGTAVVRVTATDAQARAERRVLRSVVEEEILADSPTAYYTLGEPEGATTAADTSGNQAPALATSGTGTAVVFGTATGPSTDGLTAATFASGQYLLANVLGVSAVSQASLGVCFSTSTVSQTLAELYLPGSSTQLTLSIDSGGFLLASIIPDSGAVFATSVNAGPVVSDGLTHSVIVTFLAGVGLKLYLDGVLLGTSGGALGSQTLTVSNFVLAAGADASGNITGGRLTGSLAHASYSTTALSGTRAIAQTTAATTGFAGESGVARITRIAGYAGLTIGTADTSLTNVPFVDFTGQSAWQAIQDVCDAEMGVAYIAGAGTLTFHNRQRVTMKTTPDLTLNGFIRPDAESVTDDQDLLNYLTVTSVTTGVDQVVRDTTSETTHGRYSDAKSFLVTTDPEAIDRGNWLIYTRKEPSSSGRYGTLTVNLYGMTPAQQSAAIAALEHGCWLRAIAMPTQTTGGTTVDVVVEGVAENQAGDEWSITCNVVAKAALYPKVFILDSSVLDGPDLLAV